MDDFRHLLWAAVSFGTLPGLLLLLHPGINESATNRSKYTRMRKRYTFAEMHPAPISLHRFDDGPSV